MITKKNRSICGFIAAMLSTVLLSGAASVSAAETGTTPNFFFDQIVVTAQRYEKREIDTPAAASIYTYEDLKATGASNVQEALKFTAGLSYQAYGAGGTSLGNMSSKTLIRGSGSGTLVLINGTPLNIRGSYSLEDIPIDDVERVEIIKGGGSVLYGSEATAGVINIITKKERQNSVTISGGNFGQQDHNVSLQMDKLGLRYGYEKWKDIKNISSSGSDFKGTEKNNVSLSYNFDKNWSALYNYNHSEFGYESYGKKGKLDNYDITKNFLQFNYNDNHIKGNFYYNDRTRDKDTRSGKTLTDSEEKNHNYGFDFQKDWQRRNGKLLAGLTYQNENYESDDTSLPKMTRHNYSVYSQWEQALTKVNTVVLSARESWTGGAPMGLNYSNFSGQGQFIHKLNDNENIYASIGQSFKMPTLNQVNNTTSQKPDLKPQTGTHYELGWKKNSNNHKWRLAVFNYFVKDNISATSDNGTITYSNEDIRNTGIELTCDINGRHGWNYNWGVCYSNPENKPTGTTSMGKAAKGYWDRQYGRLQLTGGTTYQMDKWRVSLNATYLGQRVKSADNLAATPLKPYLLTSLNLNYSVDKNRDIFFTANNILDREDIITHSTTDYYATPFNYKLGYKVKF